VRIALTHAYCWPEVRRGAERFLPSLGAALARRGHDVVHLSSAWKPGTEVIDGVRTVRIPRRHKNPYRHEADFGRRLLPRLVRQRFDAVHSLQRRDALASIHAARLHPSRRTVFTDLGLPSRSYWDSVSAKEARKVERVVRGVDVYSAMSRCAVDCLAAEYGRTDGVVVPGGVDLGSFVPATSRAERPTILFSGASDGFLSFELERRGAAEVVATDLSDHQLWDWPPHLRAKGLEYLNWVAGPEKGRGLKLAKELLGSAVQLADVSAYDLSPDRLGEFDVVVCGSLLLHLRDPLRALAAIRSVCRGSFLCTNQIDMRLTVLARRAPTFRFHGTEDECQWFVPNPAGHRHMVCSAGFEIERESRPYAIPFGVAH